MGTLLVAHGTVNPHGVAMIGELGEQMARRLGEPVRTAFVDVLGPSPTEVLAAIADEPTVLVPAFLSAGYHVRTDLPRLVAGSGHPTVTVTPALGPSPDLTRALLGRLVEAGWRPGDAVVLAVAGTRDRHAQSQLRTTAAMLSALVGVRVPIGFAAPSQDGYGYPAVSAVVAGLRAQGYRRVAVASYLLAEGVFQQLLRATEADVVAEPLGLHPSVIRLACARRSRSWFERRPLASTPASAPILASAPLLASAHSCTAVPPISVPDCALG